MNIRNKNIFYNKNFINNFVNKKEFGAITSIIVVFVIFTTISKDFFSVSGITCILTLAAELGIMSIGVSLLMMSGEFDISVGSVMGFCVFMIVSFTNRGLSPIFSILFALIICGLIGVLNGIITVYLKIPSFIATLGAQMFWRGTLLLLTRGFPLRYEGSMGLMNILGARVWEGLRMQVFWFFGLAILFSILLTRTSWGNWTLATGGNEETARGVGVNTRKVKITNFAICSMMAGFAGAVNIARYLSADPTFGMQRELEAIASCVIGGNLLQGGFGTIIGTFIGAILMSSIRTGLILAGIDPYLYFSVTGIVIVIAVIINEKTRGGRDQDE